MDSKNDKKYEDNDSDCDEVQNKTVKFLLAAAAVAISIIILSVLTGCATDPNHESMDECHYESWHGSDIKVCYE